MPHRYPSRPISRLGWRLGLGLAVLLGSAGLVLANTLSLFEADYTGAAVRVEWEVSTETDLTSFKLSRRLPKQADFVPLDTLPAAGLLHYTYLDTTVAGGRSGLLPGPVEYRLNLRGPGPERTYATAVAGTTSPVQRSWGTIKAMFR